MNDGVLDTHIDAGIGALGAATTPAVLAQVLCTFSTRLAHAATVLVERVDGAPRTIASAMPDGTSDAWVSTTTGGSGAAAETTELELSVGGTEAVLVVAGPLAGAPLAAVELLVDVAVAVADRMDVELALRRQSDVLASIQERLGSLDAADPARPRRASAGRPAGLRPTDAPNDLASASAVLTAREREILEAVVAGSSNATIAGAFGLSVDTVKTHVKRILRKTGATNRTELIARSRSGREL